MRPLRVKPLHVGTNPFRNPIPEQHRVKDTTSYVTSYDIDHTTLKVTARVITAPASLKIEQEMWFDICDSDGRRSARNAKDIVRDTVKANLTILMGSRFRVDEGFKKITETEQVALDTLREMINEEEYRRYLRYGFVTIRGGSGDLYQVFRNRAHTVVWRNGEIIEEVCVRINHMVAVPPTDNVIAFLTMISADEEEFKNMGNRYRKKAA
jgi:hypothetical protein